MYVCVCHAVTESDIHEAVVRGVRTAHQLQEKTGCGTGCGMCADTALQELAVALREEGNFLHIVPAPSAA